MLFRSAYGRTHGGPALQALLNSGVDALEVVYRASCMHTGDDLTCVPLRERMRAIDDVRDYVLAASSPKVRKASATVAAGWYGTTIEEMLNGSKAA